MASLQDILAEIFAPNPATLADAGPPVPSERQSMPNAEPFSVPVPNAPNTGPGPTMSSQDDNPLMAWLKQKFSATPQPPDGMDARTYQPGRRLPQPADFGVRPALTPLGAPAERPWATTTPDTDEGYAKRIGFVPDANNDPGRVPSQMVPSASQRAPFLRRYVDLPPSPGPYGPARQASPTPQSEPGNEMARIFRNLFQGAAAVDPTAPKLSAFAQGAAGAAGSRYKEIEAEKVRQQQAARQNFEDALKVRADTRAESKERREGVTAGARKNYYEARAAKITNPALDTKDKIAIERLVRDHGRDLQRQGKLDTEILPAMEAYRKQLEADIAGKKRAVEPASPAKAPAPPKAGDIMGGYRFKGGDPADKKNWEKAP